jgi:hypothetical protein
MDKLAQAPHDHKTITHTEPELPNYKVVATSLDFERHSIKIRALKDENQILHLYVPGRRGLNILHAERVGYEPDADNGTPIPMSKLLNLVLGTLAFSLADDRGDYK